MQARGAIDAQQHTPQNIKESAHMTPANDMKAATSTYVAFIDMIKWAVPVIGVIALIVVLLISR